MKHWWRSLIVFLLGIILSLGLNTSWSRSGLAVSALVHPAPSELVQQAQKAYQTGKFKRSLRLLSQANQVYQGQNEYLQQGQIFCLTSLVQQQMGKWELAAENIALGFTSIEKLNKSRSAIAFDKSQAQVLAQIWNTKGHLELATGKSNIALKDWERAKKLYRQTEDATGVAGSLLNMAQALEDMGFYHRSCNSILEAFDRPNYDCRNLTTVQVETLINQTKKTKQSWQIEALSKISNSLLLQGKLVQAETFVRANQIVVASLTASSPLTTAKILLSLANINKAIAFRGKEIDDFSIFNNRAQTAIKYYRQLIRKQTYPKLARKYRLPAQLNLLSLYVATQQWSKAQNLVSHIQISADDSFNRQDLYAAVKFALDLERLKQNQIAIKYSWQDIAQLYLNTTERATAIGDLRARSYALGYLGMLQSQHKLRLELTCQQLIEQALNLAQQIRAPEVAYRWQWQLGKIYARQNRRELAIANYQASLDTLASLRTDLASLAKEIQFDFHAQIEPVYKEFAQLLLIKSASDRDIATAIDAIESLQVAELDNYFQDACTTYEAQINPIDKNAIALYTLVLPHSLETIMVMNNPDGTSSSSTFHHHTQAIAQQDLETIVRQLRLYITEPDRTVEVQQLSTKLYDLLIKPFEAELIERQPKNLVFILDSILQTLPMSVLYDGEQYLLEKYAIALTPGLRMLNLQSSAAKPSFLAGGISKALQVQEQKFSALDSIKTELNLFADFAGKVLLNKDFTRKNLLQQIERTAASHIHIATHGQFSSNPDRTFLLLWQQLLTIKEFGDLLQIRQQKTNVPIDLLVLSACDTASGDRYAALGLAGVAVRSGALSTLATLWQVNDESTTALMTSFYQHLQSGITKAEALRLAQLELWQRTDKDWQVPAFWSAYIMIGNWQ